MSNNNKKLILASWLFLTVNLARAVVPASVDRSELEFGQSLTLTITLSDSGQNPDLTPLQANFDIYNTGTTSQTSIINGHTSSQSTFTASLIPKNQGKQTIPAIKVGNDTTKPIEINVEPAGKEAPVADKASNVYVTATTANASPYVGVPTILSVKIYYSVPVNNLNMAPLNIANLKIEPLDKSVQYQATENGKTYQVVEQKFILTANQAGSITLPPVKINGTIADDSGNDIFGIVSAKPFMALSKPVMLHIKPIPAGVDPGTWLPAQDLKASDSWSTTAGTIMQGEPITRTVTIEATGVPAASIPEQNFATPANTNAYPDKTQANTVTDNGRLVGSKIFKIAYIPNKAGNLTFPETKINWWDTATNSMKTTLIPAKTFIVSANNTLAAGSQTTTTPTALVPATPAVNNKQSCSLAPIPASNKFWIIMSSVFATLWLFTLVVAVRIYRYKSLKSTATIEDEHKPEPAPSLKQALTTLKSACEHQDLATVNQALINWANLYWDKKTHTVSAIKDLAGNSELNQLIDEFNLALYRDADFNHYQELYAQVEVLANSKAITKKPGLRGFYPE